MSTKNTVITLEGSSKIIAEYLRYAINSIIFQRGIYPAKEFEKYNRYGVLLYISKNEGVKRFLDAILPNIQAWCGQKLVISIMLVVYNSLTKEVAERWEFNIKYEKDGIQYESATADSGAQQMIPHKPSEQIYAEICSVMRQITSTIALLPLLDFHCTFDVLVNKRGGIPSKWSKTGSIDLSNTQTIHTRQFATGFHMMKTSVTYSLQQDK
ncbi:mitotic spindle assembly checkpoint protein mad2 [Anopheles darlingi]|uniref:Mitotic spindle assembly checkpoint protein mad2 n=1 Tax=Anopheles darlingi TaxID=43151 RepID=W5JQZ4_ANODA|nr:mitotic spindle assembly checkpoint protein MAD2A-like [Anopheles darlingi]ETN66541.1 mitotic spindle assembly checkpoint protein mad2 [Anopheles darlingi]